MILTTRVMGHMCELVPDADDPHWVWSDTRERLPTERPMGRNCVSCGLPETPEGHDPCIANLPGVRNACCGHGVADGYIQFDDERRTVIRGRFDHVPAARSPGDEQSTE